MGVSERGNQRFPARLAIRKERTPDINAGMRRKHGLTDRYIEPMQSPQGRVAIAPAKKRNASLTTAG